MLEEIVAIEAGIQGPRRHDRLAAILVLVVLAGFSWPP